MTMKYKLPFTIKRRQCLRRIQDLGLIAVSAWFSPGTVFAKPEDAHAAIKAITGGAAIKEGRVKLIIPPLVENGNLVVLKVTVESPMTANNYVKSIHIVAEGNPVPNIFTAYLTPRSGKANLTTRVRLADSQLVWAIAQMNDGSFWQGSAETLVTLSACTEMV
jgi:sulfur-oxidizing protein SoxY